MLIFKILVLIVVGFVCSSGIFVGINSLRKGEQRGASVAMLVILVPILFITAKWTFTSSKKVETPNPVAKAVEKKVEAPKKELTQEEKDVIEYNNKVKDFMTWKDAQFSPWDGSCTPLISLVKSTMNDPKSFKHYESRFKTDMFKGVEVEMEFGGTNAFGGMIRNTVRGYLDYTTKTVKITYLNGEKVN